MKVASSTEEKSVFVRKSINTLGLVRIRSYFYGLSPETETKRL
jgi:hypothetical protein